jgi:hypothetical protein
MSCGRGASLEILFQAEQRFAGARERTFDPVALCSNRSDSYLAGNVGPLAWPKMVSLRQIFEL